jgi:uroporphyrinogen-III synthase
MATAAVGGTTATAAREKLGATIKLIPFEQNAAALAEALRVEAGTRVLLPQAENAQAGLRQRLAARGAAVTEVVAYRTIRGSGGLELAPLLNNRQVDAVNFTSAAAVGYFVERVRDEGGARFDGVCAACLSERIGHAAREHGFKSVTAAQTQTLEALVAALVAFYK